MQRLQCGGQWVSGEGEGPLKWRPGGEGRVSWQSYVWEVLERRDPGALGSRPGARRYPLMCPAGSPPSSSLQGLVTFKGVAVYLSWEEWRLFTGPEDPVAGRDVG